MNGFGLFRPNFRVFRWGRSYTEPRYTKDLDLWVERSPTNADKILKALDEFGFASMALTLEDFVTPEVVVQLGVEPVRIDLLTDVAGLDFAGLLGAAFWKSSFLRLAPRESAWTI